ncbi:LysR family transcriptional regulator [Vibrio astriarenae]|uniref:LysR family transcriptional regulator n=1 Tax=Vibrio astriarenae TaxID=1481923 RepID=UPI00373708BD
MDKLEMMKTFLCVAQEGSFSKAANKLELSPQLVSKYVAVLEQKLRSRLFHRTTRKVTLTEAGKLYSKRCIQILTDIEEAESALADWHQNVSGELTLNAPMSFGHRHLPALLADFRRQYPDVDINLTLTDDKIDLVEAGVDVALRIGALKSDLLIAKKVADMRLAMMASPDYLKRFGTPKTVDDLRNHVFLNYSFAEQDQLKQFLGINVSELNIQLPIKANNGDYLVEAAAQGGGIVLQPTFIASDCLREGRLVEILPQEKLTDLGLYLVYTNRTFLPNKVRSFIDFTANYYDGVPEWEKPLLNLSPTSDSKS